MKLLCKIAVAAILATSSLVSLAKEHGAIRVDGDGYGGIVDVLSSEIDTSGFIKPELVFELDTKKSFSNHSEYGSEFEQHPDALWIAVLDASDGFIDIHSRLRSTGNHKTDITFTDVPVGIVKLRFSIQSRSSEHAHYLVKNIRVQEGAHYFPIVSETSFAVTGDGVGGHPSFESEIIDIADLNLNNPKMVIKLSTNGTYLPDDRLIVRLLINGKAGYAKYHRLGNFSGEITFPKVPDVPFQLQLRARTDHGNQGIVTVESVKLVQ